MAGMRFILPLVLIVSIALIGHTSSHASPPRYSPQGSYITGKIDSFAGQYWTRVAGWDARNPPHVNGHDEFANAWQKEALAALHGLHAVSFRQHFPVPGFTGAGATHPGTNVIVVVPGTQHADQAVVVGSHYDGEPSSKGSAYDDTSGSMILLALARVMGDSWRANGLPARTVEFVLFDAEEQGLIGSVAYTFAGAHHAIQPKTTVMIDEEQSGIAYPVHPFGLFSEQALPSYAVTNGYAPPNKLGTAVPGNPAALNGLTGRLTSARATAFSQLRSAYSPMQYRGGTAPVFGNNDLGQLRIGPNPLCCSDNAPFQVQGVPTVTFAGEAGYYDSGAPSWSYPYDQPQDTPAALACDTGGSPSPGKALQAALDLPLAMSAAIVNDYAPPHRGTGFAVLSTTPHLGTATHFTVAGRSSASWSFGDGAQARGVSVSHTYRKPGTYTVRVAGRSYRVSVPRTAPKMAFPFGTIGPPPIRPWQPAQLKGIAGCGQG